MIEEKNSLYEKIKLANKTLKPITLKGKKYVEVHERIKAFRKVFSTGFIKTKILKDDGQSCTILAKVGYYSKGEECILATGIAQEKEGTTYINKNSHVENCETSAVGRALGFAGFGIETSVASFEEVANSMISKIKEERN